jgi:type VI secretion system secreted protein Hcp
MAQVDAFLKLDGIEGESSDSKHGKEIELDAFRFGAIQTGKAVSGTTGSGAGKVRIEDFHFRVKPNKASPKLFFYCCNGQPITKAVLTIRKAGKDQQEYLQYTFQNVLVSSYRTSIGFAFEEGNDSLTADIEAGQTGSDDWMQYDYVSLNFGSLQVQYKTQNADGTLGGAITNGWNFQTNVSL